MRILGVLLILLGLALFASPVVGYKRKEKIPNSQYTVKTDKLIVVPRPVAVLVMGAGAVALICTKKGNRPS